MAAEELKYWGKVQKDGRSHPISSATNLVKGRVASIEGFP